MGSQLTRAPWLFAMLLGPFVHGCTVTPGKGHVATAHRTASIDDYWDDFFARSLDNAAVGYAYAIYQDGEPVASGAHGWDRDRRQSDYRPRAMMLDTTMQIASCTKPITAVALLLEMERLGIALDARMSDLLSDQWPPYGAGVAQITIRQLLSHTSGYPFGYIWSPRIENTRKLLAEAVPNPPGEYRYSNINFSLARTVLESISGRPYEEYVREELLKPAGAEGMRLDVESEEEAAFCYLLGTRAGVPMAENFRDEAGAYGWYGTVREVARLLSRIQAGDFLSEELAREMFDNGLGWRRLETHAGLAYRYEGQWVVNGNLGVHTGVGLFPDNVAAVLFINTNGRFSPTRLFTRGFAECYPRIYGFVETNSRCVIRIERPPHADTVRWTADGSRPNARSPTYTGPIIMNAPVTIRAQGFAGPQPVTFVNTRTLEPPSEGASAARLDRSTKLVR